MQKQAQNSKLTLAHGRMVRPVAYLRQQCSVWGVSMSPKIEIEIGMGTGTSAKPRVCMQGSLSNLNLFNGRYAILEILD